MIIVCLSLSSGPLFEMFRGPGGMFGTGGKDLYVALRRGEYIVYDDVDIHVFICVPLYYCLCVSAVVVVKAMRSRPSVHGVERLERQREREDMREVEERNVEEWRNLLGPAAG